MVKYLKEIPKTLQEDFAENKVVPFVGAGFSKNAILSQNMSIPDWNELGNQITEYIPDYEFSNSIDALSIFESQFSRVRLIELMAKKLYINELKPGESHVSFCNLFFDTICTTNFDFLLESTLQITKRPYSIIVSEDRLPIDTHEKTKLIKLHGDFNHPEKMVVTEHDYDLYLENNKVLATYISNLFITKTLFLVGYSLEDTDIRALWQIINSRLGQLHRPAYALMVDASPIEISRFERRNVKVINLKGKKSDYPQILNQFFIEVKDMMDKKLPSKITPTSEKVREELKLPSDNKRLCFVSAPSSRISILKEVIYPILEEHSITPVTLNETIMPGDNWMAKSETLLRESSFVIVDASDNNMNVMWELGVTKGLNKKMITIIDESQLQTIPFNLRNTKILTYSTDRENEIFVEKLSEELSILFDSSQVDNEPKRLLVKKEYNAAIISAYRLLEITLRKHDELFPKSSVRKINMPLFQMLKRLRYNESNISQELINKVADNLHIRNQIVHSTKDVIFTKKEATDIVNGVLDLISVINQSGIKFLIDICQDLNKLENNEIMVT
jgi:hypothetical protein